MRAIKKLIVHCADTPDTMDIGAAEIRQWHTDPPPRGRGWKDIGYHKVVRKGGKIENGRPEEQIGAHVAGHNADSLGICWVGRHDCQDAQKQALKKQLLEWCKKYNLTVDDVYGHYEFNPHKTCPNLDMDKFREFLRENIESHQVPATTSYLPDGPSDEDINVSLEDIENQILGDKK